MRPWTRVLAVLVLSLVITGCTTKDAAPGTNDPGTGGTGGTGGDGPTGPGGTANPQPAMVEDAGTIQGPFSKSWDIRVDNVAFSSAMVHFKLSAAQAGAPVTARINLVLASPDGAVVKSAVLGLGGTGDAVEWGLTPADLPTAGTYTLSATQGSDTPAPLPSVGIASYELLAMVEY